MIKFRNKIINKVLKISKERLNIKNLKKIKKILRNKLI